MRPPLRVKVSARLLKGIRTENGILKADSAVVAAGIWSKELAAELGNSIPLETERGYHLMIRDPEVSPRVPTAEAEGKFVVTPMELGLRIAGTVEFAGLQAPPNWGRAERSSTCIACIPPPKRVTRTTA